LDSRCFEKLIRIIDFVPNPSPTHTHARTDKKCLYISRESHNAVNHPIRQRINLLRVCFPTTILSPILFIVNEKWVTSTLSFSLALSLLLCSSSLPMSQLVSLLVPLKPVSFSLFLELDMHLYYLLLFGSDQVPSCSK